MTLFIIGTGVYKPTRSTGRAAHRRSRSRAGASLVGWKPIHSESLAVHSSRRKEHEEICRKRGLRVDLDEHNRPVFNSRQERKRYMEAFHIHDNHGGYGDACGPSRNLIPREEPYDVARRELMNLIKLGQ